MAFYKYSPFGLEQGGSHRNGGGSSDRYKYNGKELDETTGWYDYGARFYDPTIGRWGQVDPLAGTMSGWSPYNYAYNNPIAFLDPLGLSPYKYNWTTEQYEDDSGNAVHWNTVNDYVQNGTTLDVHLVNDIERSGLSVGDFGKIALGAQQILTRNGIEGNLNFQFESMESMQRLPTFFTHEDRSLFLAFTNGRYTSIGSSSIHREKGTLSTWSSYEGKIYVASGIDVSDYLLDRTGQGTLNGRNRSVGIYDLSYIMAHELAHQLDAFSLRVTILSKQEF